METRLFFNSQHLPPPKGEYVVWCDGMGTGRLLARSLDRTASCVFKIHQAFDIAIRATGNGHCYPLMDGVYVTTPERESIVTILRLAFCELAREFIHTRGTRHMFMVRAGLAYGATIHGCDVASEAFYGSLRGGWSRTLAEHQESHIDDIRKSLLLSAAMANAYEAERFAPPYGVYVHESAQAVPQLVNRQDKGFISNLYQWWREDADATIIATELAKQVFFYLKKSRTHSVNEAYPLESIEKHIHLAKEYFGGLIRIPE